MPNTQGNRAVLWVMLAAVVIVAAWLIFGRDEAGNNGQPSGSDSENASVTDDASDEASGTAFLATLMPEDWVRFQNANKDIQELTPGQTIEFYVVEDPIEEDVAYFATGAYDANAKTILLGLYRYEETTYQFERLYRKTYAEGEHEWLIRDDALPNWHLVAYDHGRLVVLVKDSDDSPGRCAQPYLLGTTEGRRLYALDLASPSSGLNEYEPNAELRADAEAAEEACLEGR